MNDLSSNLQVILGKIDMASRKAGKSSIKVNLIAVTKTQPPNIVREALNCGLSHLGENKVQEARIKKAEIESGIWHFIGHLQKNKVAEAVRLFDRIDSVDSLELAQEISRQATQFGKTMPILMQVNVSGEGTKFGISPTKAIELAEAINSLPSLELHGLMTMAPLVTEIEKTRPFFAALRECRDHLSRSTGLALPILSMGMSNDFEIAIEEGSTEVRIGTALFGKRISKIAREII